jgi:hypothetical protein
MIKILKFKAEMAIRVLIVMSLFLIPALFLEANAKTLPKTQTDSTAPGENVPNIPYDQVVFDGQGKLDAVNPFMPTPPGGIENFASSLLVIIDGHQEQFSADVKLYHYLSQPVTAEDIKPGIYVGFKKDPADKIVELWIMKPDLNKIKEQTPKPAAPRLSPSGSDTLKNQNGVWQN